MAEGTHLKNFIKSTKRNCYFSVRLVDGKDEKAKDFPLETGTLFHFFTGKVEQSTE